jgi:DNA-binding MarR family transcriptional regulator
VLDFVNLVNDMSAIEAEVREAIAVANRLRPVVLRLGRRLRREASAFGITGGQATLLATIEAEERIGITELAAHEGVSRAAMSRHVDRLEAIGLVTRTPLSSGDRRRVAVGLTAEGTRTLRRVRSHRTAWLAKRLERLDPDSLAAIDEAIEPLALLLEEDAA